MLSANARLRPNDAEVAARIIDGEAILINLANGTYYSMDLAGGLLWQLIEARHTVPEIVSAIGAHYDVAAERAAADVQRIVDELVAAGLVAVADEAPAGTLRPAPPPAERLTYQPPRLLAYHDMAELLALDPPHPGMSQALSRPLPES